MRFEIVTKETDFIVASAEHETWRDAEFWFDNFLEQNIHAYNYNRYILDTE